MRILMADEEEVCGEVQSRSGEDGEHDVRGAVEVGRDCVCGVEVGLMHVTLSGVWGSSKIAMWDGRFTLPHRNLSIIWRQGWRR